MQERLALLAGKGIDSVTARLDTPASREKWAAVLDAAQLSQEQQEAIVDARQRANRQTAALFDERRRLLESLAENLSVRALVWYKALTWYQIFQFPAKLSVDHIRIIR